MSQLNLFDLVSEDFLDEFAESFIGGLLLFEFLLLVFSLIKVESFLGARLELLSIEVLELLDDIFVNGVNHVDDFIVSLLKSLNEGRLVNGSSALSSDEEDVLLSFLHSGAILFEGDQLLARLAGVESEEFAQLGSIGTVLVDT